MLAQEGTQAPPQGCVRFRVLLGGDTEKRRISTCFITLRNNKLLGTSASLLVTSALLVVTRSY